jgi:hypothetical protein
MTRIKLISVLSVSMLVLGSCGSDGDGKKQGPPNNGGKDPDSKSGPAAPLTADERACEDFYKVQLAWTGRCGGILNASPQAIARFRTLCARELASPGAEGLKEARTKCSERMKKAECDAELTECELPPGSLADGEPCGSRAQCKSRFCNVDSSGCGTCEPLVAAGGACTSPADCAFKKGEITSCDFQSRSETGECSVWKVVKAGQTCSAESLCDTHSHCDVADEAATSGTCLANKEKGESCDNSRACRPGFVCRDQKCSDKPKKGAACDAVDDCADGLACDKTCKPVVYVGGGEQCDLVRRCARGRCVQPVTQSENGQTTAAGDASCVDPLEDGEACGDEEAKKGQACDHFARCIGGKCVLANPGQCQ